MPDKRKTGREILSFAGCFLLAGLMGLFFAETTSPLRPHNECWDSLIFKAIGRLWAEGLTPYVDIFDHKGPLLFLIQRLCYSLPLLSPRWWIYLAETLFNGTTLWLGLRICRRAGYRGWFRGLLLLLTTVYWAMVVEYGNLCEEYSLPFVMLSLEAQIRQLQGKNQNHPPRYAFLYGLCFGCVCMIRVNNGLLIAVLTLFIALRLIHERRWKNLLCNAGAILAGFLLAVLPFLVYFGVKHALPEMLYAVWTYNFGYLKNGRQTMSLSALRQSLHLLPPIALCLGAGILHLFRKRWMAAACGLGAGLATAYICLAGYEFTHYFMMAIPLFALGFALLRVGEERWMNTLRRGVALLLIPCVVYPALRALPQKRVLPETTAEAEQYESFMTASRELVDLIPVEDRDHVSVYGYSSDLRLFLWTELQPVGRYCFLQAMTAEDDPEIGAYITRFYQSREAAYLIQNAAVDFLPEWGEAVRQGYEVIAQVEGPAETWLLYRRVEE